MPDIATTTNRNNIPLCVDLDGTVIKTDLVWESLVVLLKHNPFYLLLVPFWLMRGRAFLKRQIANRVLLDVSRIPYNQPFIDFLKGAKKSGRRLLLVTASDAELAQAVAEHVAIFDEVIASDGKLNLRGKFKRAALTNRFGAGAFDYAANSTVDLPVWEDAAEALVVEASPGLEQRVTKITRVGGTFPRQNSLLRAFIRVLRPHHWVKNLIIFVPLLTSHQITNGPLLLRAFWAFVAFCLCASAAYIINDLLDLDSDRQHRSKKSRPFASGDLPISFGFAAIP